MELTGLAIERADLTANCIFFGLARHVTTTALLTAGVDLLDRHPRQRNRFRTEPSSRTAAVEELVRYVSPTTLGATTAITDATIAGCHLAVTAIVRSLTRGILL